MSRLDRDCLRVLRTHAADRSIVLAAVVMDSRSWASALFIGSRLMISVRSSDNSLLDDWLIALPVAELTWRGHFVASADIVERGGNAATIELLVVED